jgi:hypothetical protein
MVDHLTQETYNVHRLAGGNVRSFQKMYPHLKNDTREMEKKWKEVEKQEKANNKSWAPGKGPTGHSEHSSCCS